MTSFSVMLWLLYLYSFGVWKIRFTSQDVLTLLSITVLKQACRRSSSCKLSFSCTCPPSQYELQPSRWRSRKSSAGKDWHLLPQSHVKPWLRRPHSLPPPLPGVRYPRRSISRGLVRSRSPKSTLLYRSHQVVLDTAGCVGEYGRRSRYECLHCACQRD